MKVLTVIAVAALAILSPAAASTADEVEDPACITCWGIDSE